MRRTMVRALERTSLFRPAFEMRGWLSRLRPGQIVRNGLHRFRGSPDGRPLPTTRARCLVAGSADIGWFIQGGALAAASIEAALGRQGVRVQDLDRILDFGCGCGRVLRHWPAGPGRRLFGTDMQPELLRECARVLPHVSLAVNGPEPPLPFAAASFDLVYSLSVLTHLTEAQQLQWRAEVRRVLRPGGHWLCTTQGRAYLSRLSPDERERFEAGALVCQRQQYRGLNLCQTFHPEAYIRNTLAEGFAVCEIVQEGARGNPRQDLVLLQRSKDSRSQED